MKKGFTLVELLAVIVILGVLALITTPIVKDTINKATEKSNIRSVEKYIEAADLFMAEASAQNTFNGYQDINILSNLEVDNPAVTDGYISYNSNREIAVGLIINDECYIKAYDGDISSISKASDTSSCRV